ncbi:hypothetical protein LJE71_17930 [Xanthobacter autotrophicus]|uniref:hypothetical protein n=1 Tax=Xanthobacter autotrophicus TaxID=280 RepID=UPI001E5BD2B6|nr:hypothetical protein [Xanthobacter autotrophicus]UDQ88144.1 hypothetical protein LJE71_17930 [Xanthobacter autotrophicus]
MSDIITQVEWLYRRAKSYHRAFLIRHLTRRHATRTGIGLRIFGGIHNLFLPQLIVSGI